MPGIKVGDRVVDCGGGEYHDAGGQVMDVDPDGRWTVRLDEGVEHEVWITRAGGALRVVPDVEPPPPGRIAVRTVDTEEPPPPPPPPSEA